MNFVMCKNCVLDNTEVPDLDFNADGICKYCRSFFAEEKDRQAAKTNLPWIYNTIRKDGISKKFDVILGLSGGADSSTCLHHLVQNGIRVLCVSMDNGFNDAKADENIMRLVEGLKVPFERIVIDLDRFRDLLTTFLQSGVKNIEIPTDHILRAAVYEAAMWHGVKWIISGGNYQTESVMPEIYGYEAADLTHIKGIYKKFTGKKLTGLPVMSTWQYVWRRFVLGIKVVNLLDYVDYHREKSIKMLEEKYGYRPYGEKHGENILTRWFQNFYLPTKWKLDKRKPHLSSLILSGQITKKEALEELAYPPVYPHLGIEEQVMNYPKHDHLEYPNSKRWRELAGKIYRFYAHPRRQK